MIAIKGIFGDWLEVDIPKAKEYVKKTKHGITNMREGEKNKYINSKRLKGITVEELEKWTM